MKVWWEPPRFNLGSIGHPASDLERLKPGLDYWIQKLERERIDHIISQPHWRPTLTVLAVAIRRIIRTNWSAPCD